MTNRSTCQIALAVAVIVAVSALLLPARSAEALPLIDNKLSFASSYEHNRAPTKMGVSAFTKFEGNKNQVEDKDLDLWSQQLRLAAEVAIPGFTRLSFFAEGGYQFSASGDLPQGWTNILLGAKFAIIHTDNIVFSVWAQGEAPLGSEALYPATYTKLDGGTGLTIGFGDIFAVNGVAMLGTIFDVEADGVQVPDSDTLQFQFIVEAVFSIPALGSARVGLEGFYRDRGIDKAAFNIFAEAQLMMFFLKVVMPFDIDQELAGVEDTWEKGDFVAYAGVFFRFG
jgi:hypothetical protein